MKFTIKREYLLKPLQKICGILNVRPIIPILNHLLLQVKHDNLYIIGTNLEIEILTHIILSMPYDIGETTVPARKFFDICRSLPEGAKIEVQLEDHRILVRSGKSRFLLLTLPSHDFPNLGEWESKFEFNTSEEIVLHLIKSTQFSMAQQDVRYYLNGMLLEIEGRELRTVATDGHRLAACSCYINTDVIFPKFSVIVPRKSVIELMRILDWRNTPLHIQIGINNIRIHIRDFIFTSKLVDGRFPDYRCVFPKNPNKTLEVKCDILKQAFSRVAILSNERFRGIRLFLKKNQLRLITNNNEQEEAEETLDVTYEGSEMEIGLNVSYILDVLNMIQCKNVRILMMNPVSSIQIEDVIIKNNTEYNATYIVMPMRL